ncbi:MAG: nitronate monooxygenase [Anaerolineae bacterium]
MKGPVRIGGGGQREFLLRRPVMPAAGFLGYGRAYAGLLDPRAFGALVTRTTTLQPHTGPTPGFARTRGGFVFSQPPANPGLSAVLRQFAPSWARWDAPVIFSAWLATPEEAETLGRRLEPEPTVAGIEVVVPPEGDAEWLGEVLEALQTETELPILVKLPQESAVDLAPAAVEAGASALVLATPYLGTSLSGLTGPVYGPSVLPHTLRALSTIAPRVDIPVIASGGIYESADAAACASAGAVAVQLDGLLLLDPMGAARLALSLSPTSTGSG